MKLLRKEVEPLADVLVGAVFIEAVTSLFISSAPWHGYFNVMFMLIITRLQLSAGQGAINAMHVSMYNNFFFMAYAMIAGSLLLSSIVLLMYDWGSAWFSNEPKNIAVFMGRYGLIILGAGARIILFSYANRLLETVKRPKRK